MCTHDVVCSGSTCFIYKIYYTSSKQACRERESKNIIESEEERKLHVKQKKFLGMEEKFYATHKSERRKKRNVLPYTVYISEYISNIGENRNNSSSLNMAIE